MVKVVGKEYSFIWKKERCASTSLMAIASMVIGVMISMRKDATKKNTMGKHKQKEVTTQTGKREKEGEKIVVKNMNTSQFCANFIWMDIVGLEMRVGTYIRKRWRMKKSKTKGSIQVKAERNK